MWGAQSASELARAGTFNSGFEWLFEEPAGCLATGPSNDADYTLLCETVNDYL